MNNGKPIPDNEILFEQAQKLAHFGVWELYSTSSYAYWSDAVRDIVGIGVSEKVGLGLLKSIVHTEDWGKVINSLVSAIQNGTPHHLKYRIYKKDTGELRWLECTANQHVDKKTGEKKLIGVAQDISEHVFSLEALKKSNKEVEHYKELANSVQNLVAYIDKEHRYIVVNKAYARFYNLKCEQIVKQKVEDIIKEKYQIVKPLIQRALNGEFFTSVNGFKAQNDNRIYGEAKYAPYIDENNQIQGTVVVITDITESRKKEQKIRLFATIIENTIEGVVVTDSENQIIAVNKAFCDITRFSEKDVIGKNPSILKSDRHDGEFYKSMWKSIVEKDSWSGEIYNRHNNNGVYPEWLSINVIRDDNGNIINYIGTFSDLSDLKEAQNSLVFLSHHDALTGLANRDLLQFRLEHSIAVAKRNKQRVAVLFLDLDNFKRVNDSYGHDIGDEVLMESTKRFSKILRSVDTLARFGGDEFVIVLENIKNERNVIAIANKLLKCFKEPFEIEKTQQFLTVSIGISIYPDSAKDFRSLLKAADAAMYKSKDLGKNNFSFYDSMLGEELLRQMTIENDLRIAISKNQFELYYQPQISCLDGKIIGFEALVRWNHPKLGCVYPERFITIAEQSRLIIPLGRWILNEACLQVAAWQKEGIFDGRIAVNISGIQMEHGDLLKEINEALSISGINPNMLELEITESVLMKKPKRWIKVFKQIRSLGVHLSIDDFGTGYSSLSYLRQFPLDKLKIDKSFIVDIPNNNDACAIVNSIIVLAKSLELSVLAEGVEKQSQADYIASKGCDFIQGFLYDKPLDYEEATKKLTKKEK
ncbi:MAG: EAL domain-containing protein [Epsilonproteobacteria bacterium]|nr:EAL domain-containing protein [Campylobacterota bacterium]